MEKLTLIIHTQHHGQRLDKALLSLFPHASTRERRRIWDSWRVLVNGKQCSAGHTVMAGDRVGFAPKEEKSQEKQKPWPHVHNALHRALAALQMPYCIASYMQWHFFAKPSGLHSAHVAGGGKSLEDMLAQEYFCDRPFFLCNRLDAATSGIVVVAENEGSVHVWHELENAGLCQKKYLALVQNSKQDAQINQQNASYGTEQGTGQDTEQGTDESESFDAVCMQQALDTHKRKITKVLPHYAPPLRHTHFQSLGKVTQQEYAALCDFFPTFPHNMPSVPLTLMGCTIQKGARHQIRAHAAHAGFALFQDTRYVQRIVPEEESFLLHHAQLAFTLRGGETRYITCPAPWQEIFHKHTSVQDFLT